MSGFWCFPDGLYTSFADSTEDMEAGEWKYLWFTLWSKRRTTGVRTAVSVIRSRRGIFWAVYSIWWIWGTFESGCFWCVSCQRDSFQFFWCLVFVWIDSNYLFGVLDWKKCDSLRPGTAGGSAGIAGGKFYVDELQTAIFLVYYCDGGDVREEEKYGIWVKMDQGCFSREEYSWSAKWIFANFNVWLRISLASFLGIWYIYPIKHIFFFINYSNVSNVLN